MVRRAVVRHGHLDDALFAETGGQIAGRRVERDQPRAGSDHHARRIAAFARPERQAAARGLSLRQLIFPDRFSGVGFEREHFVARWRIQHAVDDERHRLEPAGTRSRRYTDRRRRRELNGPRLLQLADVIGRDLCQRRKPRGREIVVVGRPVADRNGRAVLLRSYDQGSAHQPGHQQTRRCLSHPVPHRF